MAGRGPGAGGPGVDTAGKRTDAHLFFGPEISRGPVPTTDADPERGVGPLLWAGRKEGASVCDAVQAAGAAANLDPAFVALSAGAVEAGVRAEHVQHEWHDGHRLVRAVAGRQAGGGFAVGGRERARHAALLRRGDGQKARR